MTKLTWSSPKLTTRTLTFGALLIAIQLCLSKLSVGPENVVKVGLGFIGTAMIGYFLGPWLGGVALVLNDLISNTVFQPDRHSLSDLPSLHLSRALSLDYFCTVRKLPGSVWQRTLFPDPDFKRVLQHDVDLFDVLPDQNGRCLVWPFGSATSKGNHQLAD